MKTFRINKKYQIVCEYVRTRNGFKHTARLFRTGLSGTTVLISETKVCYLNRTWESFEYESVMRDLLNKAKIMTDEQKSVFLEKCKKNEMEDFNSQMGFIAGIAKLGEILCENQSDKNDWKKRMLNAGLADRGLIMPEDWDQLSENEKEKRLNGVIKHLQKV